MPATPVPKPDPAAAPDPPLVSCAYANGGVVALVAVAGELDIATVPELDRALRRAEADARLVVLDLRGLEFGGSGAAHLVLDADRRMRRAGGRLVVVRGPARVDRLFELVGIDRELDLVDRPPVHADVQSGLEDAAA